MDSSANVLSLAIFIFADSKVLVNSLIHHQKIEDG